MNRQLEVRESEAGDLLVWRGTYTGGRGVMTRLAVPKHYGKDGKNYGTVELHGRFI
jgi:hypothetical protein